MNKKLTFIVTIKVPSELEDQVVRNYLQMALKKYDKVMTDCGKHTGYFDGIQSQVAFSITEVPMADDKDLRSIITQIKKVETHLEKIDASFRNW